jgi:hypothetical protein
MPLTMALTPNQGRIEMAMKIFRVMALSSTSAICKMNRILVLLMEASPVIQWMVLNRKMTKITWSLMKQILSRTRKVETRILNAGLLRA